jgi:hypothetical protein
MTRYDIRDDYTRLPVAEVIAVRNYRGCQRTHLHPWPESHPEPGTFTAGCGRGDYRAETPTKGTPK